MRRMMTFLRFRKSPKMPTTKQRSGDGQVVLKADH
jgi:hypothetical protein